MMAITGSWQGFAVWRFLLLILERSLTLIMPKKKVLWLRHSNDRIVFSNDKSLNYKAVSEIKYSAATGGEHAVSGLSI